MGHRGAAKRRPPLPRFSRARSPGRATSGLSRGAELGFEIQIRRERDLEGALAEGEAQRGAVLVVGVVPWREDGVVVAAGAHAGPAGEVAAHGEGGAAVGALERDEGGLDAGRVLGREPLAERAGEGAAEGELAEREPVGGRRGQRDGGVGLDAAGREPEAGDDGSL